MDDEIKAAKRLLANYTAQRQPCTTERQEAAEALLGELGRLNQQFGWEVVTAEHILEAKFKRTPLNRPTATAPTVPCAWTVRTWLDRAPCRP